MTGMGLLGVANKPVRICRMVTLALGCPSRSTTAGRFLGVHVCFLALVMLRLMTSSKPRLRNMVVRLLRVVTESLIIRMMEAPNPFHYGC